VFFLLHVFLTPKFLIFFVFQRYLFHKTGAECDDDGHKGENYTRDWYHYVDYDDIRLERHGRSICKFLEEKPVELAMRAYIEWAFRYHYVGIYSHWALSVELPQVRERTKTICYEDMMNPEKDLQTIESALDFWFNNGTTPSHAPWTGALPGHVNYTGGHSTPPDPTLRSGLKDLIKQLDAEYYNGEIAWMNSVLPCG